MKQFGIYNLGWVVLATCLMGMSTGRANRDAHLIHTDATLAPTPDPSVTPDPSAPTPVPTPEPTPEPTPTPVPTPCPTSMNPEAITTWRGAMTETMGTSLSDSALRGWMRSCFPHRTEVPACVSRLDTYLNRNAGSNIRDDDYSIDPRRRLPDELLVSGSADFNYVLRGDIEAHAKELGWPVARYKSRHSGGFDSETSNLLMIEVPGSMLTPPVNYDRFINIALIKDPDEDGTKPTPVTQYPDPATLAANGGYPSTTTMVTVEHGTRDSKARLYFQMFSRSGNTYRPNSPNNPSSCVSCHPSGLRAISPLGFHVRQGEAQLEVDNWKQVKRLNADMVAGQRGGITWGGKMGSDGNYIQTLDTNDSGPIIGPSEPFSENTRTKEFIVGADGASGCQNSRTEVSVFDIFSRPPGAKNKYTFTSNPPVDWEKVADAMDCEMCHNNERQGVLNARTSYAQIDFKILVDQSMPMGAHVNPLDQGDDPAKAVIDDLNPNERIALANCLKEEWSLERSRVKDWLLQDSCVTDQARAGKKSILRLPANSKKKKSYHHKKPAQH